ncbi:START domain protein (macronuclear) [Tetrahymena thermophila SB210]|uniref:START domain protein n=1 Tax=Tetrahymena thermophila (strain SB210) TaxID=312017 RepID=Q240P7_TETTS|nr:START domain protein [Tetrahymena thermophila SB210]EAS02367.1 START domain protein [Tetrahymena thermophila SB210]|eukprot:XP_001022612.1 START domain protein [Tetrahymena thermophila SB210]
MELENLVPPQYQQGYLENKERLFQLKNLDEKWKLYQEKEGVKLYTREIEGQSIKMLRIETSFNASVKETCQLLFDDLEELKKSKEPVKTAEVIEEMNERGRIVFITTKPKYFVSSREVLLYMNQETIGQEEGVVQVQVGLDSHPNVLTNKNAVRTTTLLAGHFIQPDQADPSKTNVIFIIHNILNGSIPEFVQNMVVSHNLGGYIYFKNLCEQRAKTKELLPPIQVEAQEQQNITNNSQQLETTQESDNNNNNQLSFEEADEIKEKTQSRKDSFCNQEDYDNTAHSEDQKEILTTHNKSYRQNHLEQVDNNNSDISSQLSIKDSNSFEN